MADPDPTFQADADPDPNIFQLGRGKKMSAKSNLYFFLLKLVMCNFLSTNAGGGVRDEAMRGEA